MARKLASIQTIRDIYQLEGMDNIEMAVIINWNVIVKKGEYKIGDKTIYVEVDSLLPEKPEFEFLRSKHFKVKTMKLKNRFVSQGICFPLGLLENKEWKVGDDVTDILEITQFNKEPEQEEVVIKKSKNPVFNFMLRFGWFKKIFFPKVKTDFPDWIQKTDECRYQNLPNIFSDNRSFEATEKLEGCLDYGMPIITDQGILPIGQIVKGKLSLNVLSYNEEFKKCEFKKVLDFHQIKLTKKMFSIQCSVKGKGSRLKNIECTDNHKFYTKDGYKRADKLIEGEIIFHRTEGICEELKQILLGCMLGDSCLNSNSESGNYRTVHFGHSIKQIGYFNYKKKLFGNFFNETEKTKISGKGSEMKIASLRANLDLFNFLNEYFPFEDQNKSIVSDNVINALTPISLAFWYMDDGSIQNREDDKLAERIIFNTQSYDFNTHLKFQKMFLDKFKIEVTIGEKEIYKGHVLILDSDNTKKLCTLIYPYVCDSMKYKLPKKYENLKCYFEDFTFDITETITPTKIVYIKEMTDYIKQYVYDITVEDNENYFANDILVHNCSTTTGLKITKGLFGKKYDFAVCSRNRRIREGKYSLQTNTQFSNSVYWKMAHKYEIEKVLKTLAKIFRVKDSIILQGETIGPGIQGNIYELNEPEFYAYNLIIDGVTWNSEDNKEVLEEYGIKHVPIIGVFKIPKTDEEMQKFVTGPSILNPKVLREGYVFREYNEGQTKWDRLFSFKGVSAEYLLKSKLD